MAQGKFITLEGGEGAGKTTQRNRLSERLSALGYEVVVTREPGGSPGAEMIRNLLVQGETSRWQPTTELLLHFAARNEHVTHTVRPALEQGAWVISDRFADSTMAYQGIGLGVGREAVKSLYKLTVGDLKPDLTLILDLPVDLGLERAKVRHAGNGSGEDRYERMGRAFHARLRDAFLDIARQEPQRCAVIDASGDIDSVAVSIWAEVQSRLGLRPR